MLHLISRTPLHLFIPVSETHLLQNGGMIDDISSYNTGIHKHIHICIYMYIYMYVHVT